MAKKMRIYYRAAGHVPLWKAMEEGGFLEKHGLEMEMGSLEGQRKEAAEGLKAGDLDVVSGNHHNLYAFNDPRAVERMRALKFGAKIIEVPPMAMIEGIHFFKTRKADTLAIIKKHCSQLLKMHDDDEWNCFYENQAESLEKVPYPSIEAIQNVFALAVKCDPEIKEFNPLALWDLHYVKEIDDSGYIRKLYQ
jgi:hypothetical protein